MKRHLIGLFAFASAICCSAFVKRTQKAVSFGSQFMVYNGTGAERNFASWDVMPVSVGPLIPCSYLSDPMPCWLRVDAGGDWVVQPQEFYDAFDAIDGGPGPGNGLISDEAADEVNFSLQDR